MTNNNETFIAGALIKLQNLGFKVECYDHTSTYSNHQSCIVLSGCDYKLVIDTILIDFSKAKNITETFELLVAIWDKNKEAGFVPITNENRF